MTGGLFDPLRRDPSSRTGRAARSAPVVVSAIVAALAVALLVVAALRDTGDRGEPRAISAIERLPSPSPAPKPAPPAPASPAPPVPVSATGSTVRDDQEVEIQNGVRIIRPRRNGGSIGQTQTVPPPARAAVDPQAGGLGPKASP